MGFYGFVYNWKGWFAKHAITKLATPEAVDVVTETTFPALKPHMAAPDVQAAMKTIAKHRLNVLAALNKPELFKYSTLCHGDVHSANMYFGTTDTPPLCKKFDWQCFGWFSPSVELAYYLQVSTDHVDDDERVLQHYHAELTKKLPPTTQYDYKTFRDEVDMMWIASMAKMVGLASQDKRSGEKKYEDSQKTEQTRNVTKAILITSPRLYSRIVRAVNTDRLKIFT
eukprot:NODE_639_length_817_cov_268.547550_g631_i0.p1 GENE.NODE_639_length_817_cov_268.547550_g631_i0~~NODE_639_length_817_cov_268.547550_g631_i0.p1  ORF type:complete len:226 (-),score=6.11 NODE_639_length_817_cov_268.547550_g631_i0:100-777(-)